MTLSSGLVIKSQSIGVASSSSGFQGVDGILGLGPVTLTEQTVDGVTTVPTVSDNLKSQGTISTEVVGISYEPTTSDDDTNGELTFGGTDSSKYTGSITYTPITSTSPASEYWGINQSIKYGTSTTILSSTAGIVDTGTTLILIATNAYDAYTKATKAKLDNASGLLKITSSNYNNLESLFFTIGGTSFELTKNAQTWPRSLNTFIGGTSSGIYLVVGDVSFQFVVLMTLLTPCLNSSGQTAAKVSTSSTDTHSSSASTPSSTPRTSASDSPPPPSPTLLRTKGIT